MILPGFFIAWLIRIDTNRSSCIWLGLDRLGWNLRICMSAPEPAPYALRSAVHRYNAATGTITLGTHLKY